MSMASQSPRPAGGNHFGDAESDLPALGAALWRNKWQIVRPTVLSALIAIAVVEMIVPKYLSEARVLIEGRDNVFLRPNADKDIIDCGTVDQEAVTSQVQLILSRDLAREVIDKLKLGERPEFDPAIAGISPLKKVLGIIGVKKNPMRMTPEERVLDAYYDRLQVYPVEKSRVIASTFCRRTRNSPPKSPTPLPRPTWCASRRRSISRHAPPANGSLAKSKPCVRRWPTPKRRWRRFAPTPISWSAPTIRRSPRSRLAT
jgi:Chain length determinant protein